MRDKNLILVVDDSRTVLHGTCRILQKAGYETIEASSGIDGLRLTIEHKPDLVLLDVVLPDIYGYEVCRRIKAESDLAGTLVILISSLDTHEDHQAQGLEIGADGYIARPVSNRNLLAHIKSLLRLKVAEDNLRQSELKFRTVADFTYDWEYWIAPDGCILYMSQSSERITGYQRDEFVNNPELLIDIIHKDDRRNATNHLNHIEPSGAHIVDFRIITRNGEERWIAHQCHPIFDDGGKFLGRRVSNRDITDRKQIEEALRLSEAQKDAILNGITTNIAFVNDKLEIVWVNKTAAESVGRSPEEMIGSTCHSLWADPVRPCEKCPTVKAFQTKRSEATIMTSPDGRVWEERGEPVVDDRGNLIGVVELAQDITERKRLEEERLEMERKLLHAQKLESLGVMAGGIAHDFNNQLAVVLGNLELGLMDQTLGPKTRHSIESAVEAAKRSAELSRQMLVYTGNTLYRPVELDLNELLNKNGDLLKLGFAKDVTLNLESYSAIPPIKGDPHQLQRVIVNLVANASEAIGDQNGNVTIRTGVMDCDEVYLSHSQLEEKPGPGRFVFLEVSDTGSGMDPETQRKLFDPFFSTKFWGRGLGMAELIGIVKGHHGAIIVDSEVGKGTTINVLFPAFKETGKRH